MMFCWELVVHDSPQIKHLLRLLQRKLGYHLKLQILSATLMIVMAFHTQVFFTIRYVIPFSVVLIFFMPSPSVVCPVCLSICLSVCLCLHPETLLTQYLDEYMTDLHQTCINCAMQDRNEGFKFGVKRWNKVQGHRHGGITYAVMSAMGGGILHVELELLL